MQTELEYELFKEIENLENEQDEYRKLGRLLDEIEDQMLYQNRKKRKRRSVTARKKFGRNGRKRIMSEIDELKSDRQAAEQTAQKLLGAS